MSAKTAPGRAWWGSFSIDEDSARFWQIGPLRLWLSRSPREWRVVFERTRDPFEDTLVVAAEDAPEPTAQAEIRRFGFRETAGAVEIGPRLADRAVIVNPALPFRLPPGEEVRVLIAMPLWFEIRAGESLARLLEEPVFRPSDTWFGPSTREGEICYAGRTSVRMDAETLPARPQRATSPVRIRNRAKTPLPLERLRMPAPHLSLFASGDHRLWTEEVTLTREAEGVAASLSLAKEPPADLVRATRVCGPRTTARKGSLFRTFGGLFDKGADW